MNCYAKRFHQESLMRITDLPAPDRPREKLLKHGAQQLTDTELLAILLRKGTPRYSAIEIARQLIERFGSLRQVMVIPYQSFTEIHGLGLSHYAQLQAAFALGQRILEQNLPSKIQLTNFKILEKFLLSKLSLYERETFAAIFLNSRLEILAYEELFHGTLTYANVHPREVIKRAIAHNAAALIVAHNHPSGDPTPSQEDVQITQILQDSLQWLDIKILQHVIVGRNHCVGLLGEQ